MLLARVSWTETRAAEAGEHAARALELIAGAPASRTSATVFALLARRANVVGDLETARELASRALAIARAVDWPAGIAEAMSTRGSTLIDLGDPGGLADVLEAIRVAEAAGDFGTVSRGYNSLAVCHVELGDLRAAGEARLESLRIARQIESETFLRWHGGTMVDHRYREGAWDDAVSLTDAFLREVDTGRPHYMTGQVAAIRGQVRLARGDVAGAIDDVERALAAAASVADPQLDGYVRAHAAAVHLLAGDAMRGRDLAGGLLDQLRSGKGFQFAVVALPAFGLAAVAAGLQEDLLDAVADRKPDRWVSVVRSIARGELVAAAEQLDVIGSAPDVAFARLLAAEADPADDASRQAAIAFYRSVGAMARVERAERAAPATST